MNILGGEVRYNFDQPNLNGLISIRKKGAAPLDTLFMPNQGISILDYTFTGNSLQIKVDQWDDYRNRDPNIIYHKKINLGIEAKITYESSIEDIEREGIHMIGKTTKILENFFKNYNEIPKPKLY